MATLLPVLVLALMEL